MSFAKVPVFLNERSYPLATDDPHLAREAVRQLLRTLIRIKEVAPDFFLGSAQRVGDISLTSSHETIGAVAYSASRDWWRFITGMEQRSPLATVAGCIDPKEMHVIFEEGIGEALTWAHANDSLVVSFHSHPQWSGAVVSGGECQCSCATHPDPCDVAIRNASSAEHVDAHIEALSSYGAVFDGGSIVYVGESFSLRMPPRDHEPMHVHVCPRDSASPTFATVRFDISPEVLAGKIDAAVLREVSQLLVRKKPDFEDNWRRRRVGSPAALIAAD